MLKIIETDNNGNETRNYSFDSKEETLAALRELFAEQLKSDYQKDLDRVNDFIRSSYQDMQIDPSIVFRRAMPENDGK